MKLEKQVTSLKLSRKLKSLGVKQESLWYWEQDVDDSDGGDFELCDKKVYDRWNNKFEQSIIEFYSAFTVAELGERLPCGLYTSYRIEVGWSFICKPRFSNPDIKEQISTTEANARAKMLIHLIEKGEGV